MERTLSAFRPESLLDQIIVAAVTYKSDPDWWSEWWADWMGICEPGKIDSFRAWMEPVLARNESATSALLEALPKLIERRKKQSDERNAVTAGGIG